MRRTLALLLFVAVGVVLFYAVEAPHRPTGVELVRGPRVFRTAAQGVRRIEAQIGERRFAADRSPEGWRLDGVPASRAAGEALDALAAELATLRALDAFRTTGFAAFGLDPPAATLVVTTADDVQRLALGTLNSVGSAAYARRDDHARVMQVGVHLLDAIQRVFGARTSDADAARAYWPEMG